jgi:hypothetical protein
MPDMDGTEFAAERREHDAAHLACRVMPTNREGVTACVSDQESVRDPR